MRPDDLDALPQREADDYVLFIQLIRREENLQQSKGAPRGGSR